MRPPTPLAATITDEYERPVADLIRPYTELDGDTLGSIVGVPFDTSILGRQGAKLGPGVVRQGLNACLCYEPGLGVDLSEAPRIADYGDVEVVQTNVDETWDRVSAVVAELLSSGKPLAVIGGNPWEWLAVIPRLAGPMLELNARGEECDSPTGRAARCPAGSRAPWRASSA